MLRLYLYAIVGPAPAAPLGLGLRDEPLSLVAGGDIVAVVGAMDEPPAPTSAAVRGHDAVVRRLADLSAAILPARFGTVQDAPALAEWLASGRRAGMRSLVADVAVTLHVFRWRGGRPRPGVRGTDARAAEASLGHGRGISPTARHWRRSRASRLGRGGRARSLRRAERGGASRPPPFRASVYHLSAPGSASYRDARQHIATSAGVRWRRGWRLDTRKPRAVRVREIESLRRSSSARRPSSSRAWNAEPRRASARCEAGGR